MGRSKRDFLSLVSISASLQQCAVAMGFYKVRESCENVRRAGIMMGRLGEVAEATELSCISFIKEEIGTLNCNTLFARRATDLFYETY